MSGAGKSRTASSLLTASSLALLATQYDSDSGSEMPLLKSNSVSAMSEWDGAVRAHNGSDSDEELPDLKRQSDASEAKETLQIQSTRSYHWFVHTCNYYEYAN